MPPQVQGHCFKSLKITGIIIKGVFFSTLFLMVTDYYKTEIKTESLLLHTALLKCHLKGVPPLKHIASLLLEDCIFTFIFQKNHKFVQAIICKNLLMASSLKMNASFLFILLYSSHFIFVMMTVFLVKLVEKGAWRFRQQYSVYSTSDTN